MKVGIIAGSANNQSIKYVYGGIEQALAQRHEIVYRSSDYLYASPNMREKLLEEFLLNCDVLVGTMEDNLVLKTRERLGKPVPMIYYLLGVMPRGAFVIADAIPYLKSTDVLICNCVGDLEITRKFFRNAQIQYLPFAFDESTFYPADESERQSIRGKMGFHQDDKVLLYAGRITLEKNVHTLLKCFSVLQNMIPNLHLVIVGDVNFIPFLEFGAYPLDLTSTLIKLVDKLRLDTERVHIWGHKEPKQLRDIYTMADLLVNLTLHHDENYGFAQVEAMACGTPVVGTRWGGLKDTIKDSETGYQVSTVVTGSGVKINWWEAINRILYLLEDKGALRRFREECRIHAMEKYSKARYSDTLESILYDCIKASKNESEPLGLTDFANQFWLQCRPRPVSPPPYQRGRQAIELYKELIVPYTGLTESMIAAEEPLGPHQFLVLAVPVRAKNGKIKIDDPIFPFELSVPEDKRKECDVLLKILRKEPVIKFDRLEYLARNRAKSCPQSALRWMLDMGIVLRTKQNDTSIDPQAIGEKMSTPLFSIESVDYMTDIVAIC